ncbi:RagB/SusD family nutrient uptake outer membrane protein [Maribellus maritimus]|uniref:RagB/SusD family nutrient uptake outer membrane protein n=1 Tax=Maribellus maritimus TaxID=2870838 RepID=UPI001EEA9EAF|nr:RagB/SusD family nutrient uptake outer membrane protein [Maribellus maritimus]MCG6190330.1 RagB/SusD family nutrient uptake outer membrane protein [Maribellus maritimus]
MKKNIIISFIFISILGLSGCNLNEELNTIPTGSVSELIFWQSENDALLAVNAAYRELDGNGLAYLATTTDIAMHAPSGPQTLYDIAVGTIDPTNYNVSDYWERYWIGVRKTNDPINNIDRIENGDAELLARLKAEARFLRAYYYTMLTTLWGDVPLITEPLEIQAQVSRTSKSDVVNFIIDELDAIAGTLPVSYTGDDIGRATRGAALALKARIALYNERHEVARDAAKAVMDLDVYELYPDYEKLFWYEGKNSSEVIFDHQYAVGYGYTNYISRSASSLGGGSGIDPLRSYLLLHEYKGEENPENEYENLDPRFGYNVFYPGAEMPNGEIYDSRPSSTTADKIGSSEFATNYGFNVRKGIDWEIDGTNAEQSTINFILIRYADVLLMYAEAKIELNELDDSVYDAINQVRTRTTVEMPAITSGKTQDELRQIVRNERTVELAFEGLHLFDMNRWEMGEEKAQPALGIRYKNESGDWVIVNRNLTRNFRADRDYLWPIPQEEVEVNANIGQNPNY